jgi:8-oxo-dGTP pyrophosphatase MutT (NUDIX family)
MPVRPWPRLASRLRLALPVFDLFEHRVRSPRTGGEHDFYTIASRDWVNVIAVTPDERVVFVQQYRHGVDRVTLETPGGIIDDDDASPIVAGARELAEESGYQAERFETIGAFEPNSALFDNRCHVVVALGAQPTGTRAFDDGEDLETVLLPLGKVRQRIRSGEIGHAMVVSSFYHFDAWWDEHASSVR